jgi:hypothetical protein
MMLGPCRAPSSPPEMPVPRYKIPFAAFQQGSYVFYGLANRFSRLNHHHHPPGTFECCDKLLRAVTSHNGFIFCRTRHKLFYFGGGAIVSGYPKPMVGHIQNQILSHHGQTDHPDITFFRHLFSPLSS